MKNSILFAMAALVATGTVHAKPIDFSKVSAQSNWVMHADFDALRKSEVGSFIVAKVKEDPEAAKGIAMLQAVFGLDIEAISSFTAYGRGEADKGIFAVKGGFDAERLLPMLELNESYVAKKHGDTIIHLIDQNKGDPKAMAFTAKDELIVSSTVRYTEHGLDVGTGKEPSLKPKGIHKVLAETLSHSVLTVAVDVKGVAEFNKPSNGPEAVIIQKTDAIGLVVGEQGDMLMASVVLQTADEATAKHVENIARGFTSLLALGADMEPELAELMAKTKTQVSRKGQIVSVKLGIDIKTVKETITKEMDKKRANKNDSGLD